MASLQNEQIDQSYQGLIKTADNTAAKPFPPAKLQYGDGTDTPIAIGEGPAGSGLGEMIEITSGTGTNTGILVNGTGVVVNDLNNISPNTNGLTIANGANPTTITFGFAFPGAPVTTVDFSNATVNGLPGGAAGLEVGTGTNALQNAVGSASTASGAQSIALGSGALASGGQSMAYGDQAQATSTSAASFGQYAEATATYAIAFGRTSTATADGAVAFGQQTSAAHAGAVAMGRQVQTDTADTTHVRALKIVAPDGGTGGNGITMLSPDGTEYTLTVSNAGALVIS